MKRLRRNGFVVIIAVVVIALIGAQMLILTSVGNTMLFESDTAHLRALERNLVASGLAWAGQNTKNISKEPFEQTTELDVANMGVYGASLSVTVGAATEKEAQVQISASCSRKRRTVRHREKYVIEL